jgi:OmcA/MtrC family decaheme c-type cytochrome
MDGDWSYTFNTPLPADAEGSFTVGAELFNMEPVDMGGDAPAMVRHTAENPVLTFAVTDDDPMPRRMVVDDYNCENCHSNLALHGALRHNAQYCNTCHLPAATDIGEVQDGYEEQSIHFKFMIHKIHRGADLENGYVVAGHNQSIHDYGEVEYPGDLRNCAVCHENDSYLLPLPAGLLATTTPQEWWSPMGPQAAACLSCHDSDDTRAHAYTNTAFFDDIFGESCGTCHGEGKSYAVEKVHAR